MNGVLATIIVMFLMMWGCATCVNMGSKKVSGQQSTQTTQTTIVASAADGLDLQAVGELIKTIKDPADLEKKLNTPDGINNLDLDEDGNVDYIKVTEFRNEPDEYGFALTTEPANGEIQEVATITIVKNGEKADVQVSGSENIYGANQHYHYNYGGSGVSWLLMGYMLGGFRPYMSPWSYGHYPSYYSPYRTSSYSGYKSRMNNYTRSASAKRVTSLPRKVSATSPYKGKTAASGVKAKLAQPTTAQKSFQTRNPGKAVKSGGFGRSTSGSARSKSTSRGFGGRGK